jgi:hypothetical protein
MGGSWYAIVFESQFTFGSPSDLARLLPLACPRSVLDEQVEVLSLNSCESGDRIERFLDHAKKFGSVPPRILTERLNSPPKGDCHPFLGDRHLTRPTHENVPLLLTVLVHAYTR